MILISVVSKFGYMQGTPKDQNLTYHLKKGQRRVNEWYFDGQFAGNQFFFGLLRDYTRNTFCTSFF